MFHLRHMNTVTAVVIHIFLISDIIAENCYATIKVGVACNSGIHNSYAHSLAEIPAPICIGCI